MKACTPSTILANIPIIPAIAVKVGICSGTNGRAIKADISTMKLTINVIHSITPNLFKLLNGVSCFSPTSVKPIIAIAIKVITGT